ncbi:hypothetical protein IP88_03240 [alpha proteobacterium AAP81b]|nr:hypothetical protein IP88_03240 [alpha proteobacterium AAP81b]
MAVETVAFEPDQYFQSAEAQQYLLTEALASGHAGHIADAIGIIARNRGMAAIAEETGLNRQALYAAFSETGNPTLSTLLKVLDALDMELAVRVRVAA